MKPTMLAVLFAAVAASACTAVERGPFARSAQAARTQTDAGPDNAAEEEQSPFPFTPPFGN